MRGNQRSALCLRVSRRRLPKRVHSHSMLAVRWADQIGEEALPLLVKHLDTDNDDRISFDEFMVYLSQS